MFAKSATLTLLISIFYLNNAFAEDIPIIVIAPSKKAQSISTVGTSVTVFDEEFFNNTNEYFLGDVLASGSTSLNFFQSGGHGTASAIQLRGLPKRYSTVYIDGIKMSDPSSVSNDFDFNNILTSQISRVEILKGNQSSVYGSGAIGGTINITTKRGQPGFQKDINYNTGSHGTQNLTLSFSGADENKDFYVGLERFQTDGISQMMHNDEDDRYRNNSVVANYGHKISDKVKFQSNLRVAESYLQYDKEVDTATAAHNEEQDAMESSSSVALIYEPSEQFTNKLTVANTYIKRVYAPTLLSGNAKKDIYYGDRHALMYSGAYNFDSDNSVVFGLEREDDQIGYDKDKYVGRKNSAAYITSSYFDYQKRIINNLYATFGSRFDEHSLAGNEDSQRVSLAYLFDDKSTKLKSSYGTGFRFPSLYETYYVYGATSGSAFGTAKAEKSKSFDFGIEKTFSNIGLDLDITYFDIKYDDILEGWKSNTAGGVEYTTQNSDGTVKSKGLELASKWKASDLLNFGFNYTFTSTYDGAEADDPNRNQNYTNNQMVRVPRHVMNLVTGIKIPKYENLDLTLRTHWSGIARDYGNGNRTYGDEEIDDWITNDLSIKYNLMDKYNLFFDINNILDEKYETTRDYSQMDRTFNFGIRRSY